MRCGKFVPTRSETPPGFKGGKGRYTNGVQDNCLKSKTPYLPVHLRPKFFHHLDLGRPYRACERKKSTKTKQNQFTSHLN